MAAILDISRFQNKQIYEKGNTRAAIAYALLDSNAADHVREFSGIKRYIEKEQYWKSDILAESAVRTARRSCFMQLTMPPPPSIRFRVGSKSTSVVDIQSTLDGAVVLQNLSIVDVALLPIVAFNFAQTTTKYRPAVKSARSAIGLKKKEPVLTIDSNLQQFRQSISGGGKSDAFRYVGNNVTGVVCVSHKVPADWIGEITSILATKRKGSERNRRLAVRELLYVSSLASSALKVFRARTQVATAIPSALLVEKGHSSKNLPDAPPVSPVETVIVPKNRGTPSSKWYSVPSHPTKYIFFNLHQRLPDFSVAALYDQVINSDDDRSIDLESRYPITVRPKEAEEKKNFDVDVLTSRIIDVANSVINHFKVVYPLFVSFGVSLLMGLVGSVDSQDESDVLIDGGEEGYKLLFGILSAPAVIMESLRFVNVDPNPHRASVVRTAVRFANRLYASDQIVTVLPGFLRMSVLMHADILHIMNSGVVKGASDKSVWFKSPFHFSMHASARDSRHKQLLSDIDYMWNSFLSRVGVQSVESLPPPEIDDGGGVEDKKEEEEERERRRKRERENEPDVSSKKRKIKQNVSSMIDDLDDDSASRLSDLLSIVQKQGAAKLDESTLRIMAQIMSLNQSQREDIERNVQSIEPE